MWDDAFEGDPNIVEVYVRRLRNKVDRPFERDAIRTVRGSGYRLEATTGGGWTGWPASASAPRWQWS